MFAFFCLVVVMFCYFSGIWIFCSKRKHMLIILLSLEYMVLFTFFIDVLTSSVSEWIMFFNNLSGICGLWSFFGAGDFNFYSSFSWEWFFQSFMVLRC